MGDEDMVTEIGLETMVVMLASKSLSPTWREREITLIPKTLIVVVIVLWFVKIPMLLRGEVFHEYK
jgi:hypothetical protein